MLGKLFNLTSGTTGGTNSQEDSSPTKLSPESIQEDVHTRSLLFPDTQALYYRQDQVFPLSSTSGVQPGASASPFDYDGDIDIDVRDVRIIIMQDALGSASPSLLFDSNHTPSPSSSVDHPQPPSAASSSQSLMQDLRRAPTSPRKSSLGQTSRPLVIQPGSPQPRQGAFDRRGSAQSRAYSAVETESQKAAREYREELASFSSCIFANSEVMSYKGTSTKVHIIPSETRPSAVSSSYVGDGRGSMGRSSMRSSRLAQSFTSESANAHFQAFSAPPRQQDRSKILVTRLFPVNLPNDDLDSPTQATTSHSRFSEDSGGFPFPCSPDDSKPNKKKSKPIQKRTPMYAVALVLQLPSNPPNAVPATAPKPVFRGPSSYNEQDFFPSSFGSARRSGWTMIGSGFGSESFESTYSNEVEDRMDAITQHWDIIMRTLTHLQSIVATTLIPMLKQADMSAPDPYPSNVSAQIARTSSVKSRRDSDASQMKPSKTNAKLVTLPPNCLAQDARIGQEIDDAKIRIVSGLRATRVITGQGRWGPWREEARWVAKWAGTREQGFFFFNLLTAFLSTHTEWLQALSPVWYRRRRYQQQKVKNEEDTSLPSRTIIIAKDKMAARRLIFLLSAFLPANQQLPTVRAQRPATSASVAAFGHSPPSYIVPINKEESLRRKINRRQGQRGASHTRSFSIQSQATTRSVTGIPAQLAHLSMELSNQERRSSDFIKPANLPIIGNDLNTRKSSAATANTIVPDSAIPHFSTVHRSSTSRGTRPNSGGSFAADDLKRSLKRGDSTGHASRASTDSRQGSRWGSVISGLWSTRRRDSTATTSQTSDILGHPDSPLASPTRATVSGRDKLSEMVREAQLLDTPTKQQAEGELTPLQEPDTPRRLESKQLESQSRTPDPLGAYESPVKTSINNDDGVIDVDVQFPDYLTSFETAVSSPSSSGYLSTPGLGSGLEGFEQFSRLAIDGDAPLNVAGWLKRFHPDFTLQAIPPQGDLLDEVRESLAAEPTPIAHLNSIPAEWPAEHWVDVSSAIIADTTNFTIKRLRYRRLVKPKILLDRNTASYLSPYGSSLITPALSPYEQPIKDKIEEEELFTFDEALIDAVERVIAHSSDVSKGGSATSSRSASRRRERRDSEVSRTTEQEVPTYQLDFQEVPRAECKMVVLSALSGVVQDVVDQRERESQKTNPTIPYQITRERESILRAAVRTWLENVELTDG
ncbi:folliculin-interacting protein N-terminus-domain-containing protein [Daldinia decipiens]|uniref:folliculin-interacting protein N-terminus-domain-containing protein n=1 Tax=Daldinia decipiens TaxID=326647 RepID=UPI0020C289F1|nr:folliculin-interacting protein N-terminus-domain-containing protein [Daldinia decipiens]KAI1652921.1 folliculin-interacting protein N-terminus-domain-containing protein [Daldinia decipiens]